MQTLVLVGPHGAGKTTLGLQLSKVLGWRFDDEIGKQLRLEALVASPEAHAVFRREFARDAVSTGPRIVETWHPGNLAFASPSPRSSARRAASRDAATTPPGTATSSS